MSEDDHYDELSPQAGQMKIEFWGFKSRKLYGLCDMALSDVICQRKKKGFIERKCRIGPNWY